ncbi:MAG: hypothetical protein ANABAC_0077 [Anaerolineae bacterium]|nr:MAG: hypothetical protein ANABAC_0077 [Anaerolineae bacterium]
MILGLWFDKVIPNSDSQIQVRQCPDAWRRMGEAGDPKGKSGAVPQR